MDKQVRGPKHLFVDNIKTYLLEKELNPRDTTMKLHYIKEKSNS